MLWILDTCSREKNFWGPFFLSFPFLCLDDKSEEFFGTVLKLQGLWFFHVGKVADVYNGKYSNKVCIVPLEPALISIDRKSVV